MFDGSYHLILSAMKIESRTFKWYAIELQLWIFRLAKKNCFVVRARAIYIIHIIGLLMMFAFSA